MSTTAVFSIDMNRATICSPLGDRIPKPSALKREFMVVLGNKQSFVHIDVLTAQRDASCLIIRRGGEFWAGCLRRREQLEGDSSQQGN
jgi:hypothetical protein